MNLINALADLGAATRRVMAGWGYGARLLARLLELEFEGLVRAVDGAAYLRLPGSSRDRKT